MEKIRDQIKKIQNEVKDAKDLFPARASELLMTLSALLGNVNDEIRDAEMAYNKVLLGFLDSNEKANRAKIRADISDENARRIEARNTKELAIELMRSLKYFLKAREDEFHNTI